MKTKKVSKFLILLVCCAMILAFGSASVFAAEPITTVDIEGLTFPAAGQNPDYSVNVPYDANYTLVEQANYGSIGEVFWYVVENDDPILMLAEDVFEKGKTI